MYCVDMDVAGPEKWDKSDVHSICIGAINQFSLIGEAIR